MFNFNKNIKEKSIFNHILIKGAFVFIAFNIAFLGLFVPFAKNNALSSIDTQAKVFFNSSVVAIKDDIYLDNYSRAIGLLMRLIAKSDSIEYVVLDVNKKERSQILITKNSWKVIDQEEVKLHKGIDYSSAKLIKSNSFTSKEVFEYVYPMIVHDLPLGDYIIGVSTHNYNALLNGIYQFIVTINILQIIAALLMLIMVSRKIQNQLSVLQDSAEDISKGDFSRRVDLSDIVEINRLSERFNQMAVSLHDQTNKSNMLAQVVKSSHDGVIIVDNTGRIKYTNEAFIKMSNVDSVEMRNVTSLKTMADVNPLAKDIDKLLSMICDRNISLPHSLDMTINNKKDEKHFECCVNYFIKDKSETSFYIVLSDITDRKILESELNNYAYVDKLTDIPNRRAFFERLDVHLGSYKNDAKGFSLMFLDLDDFKVINDTLGHDYGDDVLKIFASKLRASLRASDVICRLGGDEFTVILPNLTDNELVVSIAENVLESISNPIKIKDTHVKVTSSIGIVSCPVDGDNSEELLMKADKAMYKSKNKGKNRICFNDESVNNLLHYGLDTEISLNAAMFDDEIKAWYQPQIIITSNQIRCHEALMRWEKKDGTVLTPSKFNAVDIQSNLALEVGGMLLSKVCTNLKELKSVDFDSKISTNIYSKQLEDEGFPYKYMKALDLYDVDKNNIELEISGKCLLSSNKMIIRNLDILSEIGVPIAVDDVRIGNDEILSLNKIAITAIKIDKSLINNLLIDKVSKSIVSSLIHFGNELGIDVIAVGVEKEEHVEALAKLHCTIIQGNVFYEPMNLQEAKNIIKIRSRSRPVIVNW